MKRIFAVFLFLIMLIGSQEAFASKLPDKELNVLKQSFKDLKVRFDGMVELPDGTSYIPVYPLQESKNVSVKVTKTIPANKNLKDKPDFFMFNTNFAFFKVIKTKEKSTIIYNDSIPLDVKMGILPQDLLVPVGFTVPGELRILVGDLLIPITPSKEFKEVNILTGKEVVNSPRTKLVAQAAQQIANKYFYTTSFNQNTVNVLNADNGKAFKKIEFSSIPSDIKLTCDGRYLLVSTLKDGNIYIVDAVKSTVLKELKAGERASYIAVSDEDNIAYIANLATQSISMIDLVSMQMLDPLVVTGNPSYIEFSPDGQALYYLDGIKGIVYELKKQDRFFNPISIRPLFRTSNISKIQVFNDRIYTLDRGRNELDIYYLHGKPQSESAPEQEEVVNVSNQNDIAKSDESITSAVDYNYYDGENAQENQVKTEKKTFKTRIKNGFHALLYYPSDDDVTEQPLNPANQVQIMRADISEYDEPAAEEKPVEKGFKQKMHLAKEKFFEYMNYEPIPEKTDVIENIRTKVEKQMNFIKLENRANDFAVINNKIYILASDEYAVYVFDAITNQKITTIELDEKGYYNSIRVSKDKTVGILTNITSKELTLFDVKNDTIIQKVPVSVNVHNVVITGKK